MYRTSQQVPNLYYLQWMLPLFWPNVWKYFHSWNWQTTCKLQIYIFLWKFHSFRNFFWKKIIKYLRAWYRTYSFNYGKTPNFLSVRLHEILNAQSVKENRAHQVTTRGVLTILILHLNIVYLEDGTINPQVFRLYGYFSEMTLNFLDFVFIICISYNNFIK